MKLLPSGLLKFTHRQEGSRELAGRNHRVEESRISRNPIVVEPDHADGLSLSLHPEPSLFMMRRDEEGGSFGD